MGSWYWSLDLYNTLSLAPDSRVVRAASLDRGEDVNNGRQGAVVTMAIHSLTYYLVTLHNLKYLANPHNSLIKQLKILICFSSSS